MTSSKLVTIPINYTWKAHAPGSMPLMKFSEHSVWTVVFTAGHKAIQGTVGFQATSHWSQKMHHHQNCPALECGDASAAPGEGLPTPELWPPPWLEKELPFFLNDFQRCLCSKARERKKSPQRIWKLTSEALWEILGTNTWLFSFCSALDRDDRTGWFVLIEGSYWHFFVCDFYDQS